MVKRTAVERFRRRRAERGVTVFLVVLVITMLMGIGAFAARSAQVSTTASGYDRQMTQTHYLTDYAMTLVINELSSGDADAHLRHARYTPEPSCKQTLVAVQGNTTQMVSNYTCERFNYQQMQSLAGQNLLIPLVQSNPPVPGSLGIGDLQADFNVEMTDVGPASPPVAGTDLSSANGAKMQFLSATLTATGMIRPTPAIVGIDPVAAQAASIESQRAHIVVGPTR